MAESVIKNTDKYHYPQGNANNVLLDLIDKDGQNLSLVTTPGLYLLILYPNTSGFCGVTLSQSDSSVYYLHSSDGTAITLLVWLNTLPYKIDIYGASNISRIYLYQ